MAFAPEPRVRMTDEEFRLVRDLINQHCGLAFDQDSRHLLEKRLTPRLEALRCEDFTEYYRRLRYHPDRRGEFEEIVERVTTNETYFFREQYQLDAFQREILPEVHATRRRGRRLNVWSAACSTGEEAYTIAMLVLEAGLFQDWDVRVFGSDISRRVLAVARKGQYGRASFRQTDERHLRRWFRVVDGRQQVRDEVKALVTFGHINLVERDMMAMVGDMDVVFCRNALMYFDPASRRRAIDAFWDKLVSGGYLLLGHTESLINLSTAFELVNLRHDMVYRKPAR